MPKTSGTGPPRTAAQLSVLKAGNERRLAMAAERREAREAGRPYSAKLRAQQLISGELTVRDLDDDEVARGRVHDGNGSFGGKAPSMPARFRDQMAQENVRRTLHILTKAGKDAARGIVKMMNDPDVDDNIKLRARSMVVERSIGKVPDVVHVGPETEFDRLQQGVFEFGRDELDEELEE